jgi:hypothetical protein
MRSRDGRHQLKRLRKLRRSGPLPPVQLPPDWQPAISMERVAKELGKFDGLPRSVRDAFNYAEYRNPGIGVGTARDRMLFEGRTEAQVVAEIKGAAQSKATLNEAWKKQPKRVTEFTARVSNSPELEIPVTLPDIKVRPLIAPNLDFETAESRPTSVPRIPRR